jgi:hypothetical protein
MTKDDITGEGYELAQQLKDVENLEAVLIAALEFLYDEGVIDPDVIIRELEEF